MSLVLSRCSVQVLKWQEIQIPPSFNMYLVIIACMTVLIL
jgi:hypothetical protein